MESTGRGGDDAVVCMGGECTRLDEAVSNTVSSGDCIALGLVG